MRPVEIESDVHYESLLLEFKDNLLKRLHSEWGQGTIKYESGNKQIQRDYGHTARIFLINNLKGLTEAYMIWQYRSQDGQYANWCRIQ